MLGLICWGAASLALLSALSCSRKTDNDLGAPLVAPRPQIAGPSQSAPAQGGVDIPSLSNAVTQIPDNVKGKWKAVKLLVEDRQEKSLHEYVVPLGSSWTLPGSSLQVQVDEFLPDLIIQGTVFTSATGELKNPAVYVQISDGGKELFRGWLFSLFPMMHPFQHERYGITLKDAVAA